MRRGLLLTVVLLWADGPFSPPAGADTRYYQHSFFDNSLEPDAYYYTSGKASSPSTLALVNGKVPVDKEHFVTPPNALRLDWKSAENGGWDVQVDVVRFRNREILFRGDTLSLWCYAGDGMPTSALPLMHLIDSGGNFSAALRLEEFAPGTVMPRKQWLRIAIPLDRFVSASVHQLDPHRIQSVVFSQSISDGVVHKLLIDEIWIGDGTALTGQAAAVTNTQTIASPQKLTAVAYERNIDLAWEPVMDAKFERYVVYRSLEGNEFQPIGMQVRGIARYSDFIGKSGQRAVYRVTASDGAYRESGASNEAGAATHPMSDDELLTMLQLACFRYYWEGAHPDAGMTLENIPGDDRIVATGASGFGIMALVVGADRGFITRAQAVERLAKIVSFLEKAPRYHGAWSHFMNGETGQSLPVFDMFDNAGDLVETAFLMEGLLVARQYFRGKDEAERVLGRRISALWEGVEWDWYQRSPQGEALYWHWSPDWAWHIDHPITGFNETMIVYLLAIASPTHGVPAKLYYTGWAGESKSQIDRNSDPYVNGRTYFGIKLDVGVGSGGPLFFAHYSYMGLNPHIRDKFTDYFQNNRNLARINLAYCVKNPKHYKGYGANSWGLTASDGPNGYNPNAPNAKDDSGTMTPTGALASFPYTPQESMTAFKNLYRNWGDRIWDVYGPRDAFNWSKGWISPIYMGLNQAPITVMIENYRSELIWKLFMSNPEVGVMLERTGFVPEALR